jgi:hypothetical protein
MIYAIIFIIFESSLWMFVHYFSILMAPKLLEMDEVVKMIHTSIIMNQENGQGQTLLVSDASFLPSLSF